MSRLPRLNMANRPQHIVQRGNNNALVSLLKKMTPQTKTGVSQLMQALGRYYVRYINQTYHRTATLWERRFKSALVDSDNYF